MNEEKIREIANQASDYAENTVDYTENPTSVYKALENGLNLLKAKDLKFAELMVKEFINLIETEVSEQYDEEYESEDYMTGYDKSLRLACEKIKEHFGVK